MQAFGDWMQSRFVETYFEWVKYDLMLSWIEFVLNWVELNWAEMGNCASWKGLFFLPQT